MCSVAKTAKYRQFAAQFAGSMSNLSEHDSPGWPFADSDLEESYVSLANVQSPSWNHAGLGALRINDKRGLTATVFSRGIPPRRASGVTGCAIRPRRRPRWSVTNSQVICFQHRPTRQKSRLKLYLAGCDVSHRLFNPAPPEAPLVCD